jgi:hypothetical protein
VFHHKIEPVVSWSVWSQPLFEQDVCLKEFNYRRTRHGDVTGCALVRMMGVPACFIPWLLCNVTCAETSFRFAVEWTSSCISAGGDQSPVGSQGVHVYFQCAVELRKLCSAFLRTLVATHFILLFVYNSPRRHSLYQNIVLVVFFLLREVFGGSGWCSIQRRSGLLYPTGSYWRHRTNLCNRTQGEHLSRRIFWAKKILSMPSFGGEVKPSVPCRSFAACKRTQQLRGSRIVWLNLTGHFSPIIPPFPNRGLSRPLVWSASGEERGN